MVEVIHADLPTPFTLIYPPQRQNFTLIYPPPSPQIRSGSAFPVPSDSNKIPIVISGSSSAKAVDMPRRWITAPQLPTAAWTTLCVAHIPTALRLQKLFGSCVATVRSVVS